MKQVPIELLQRIDSLARSSMKSLTDKHGQGGQPYQRHAYLLGTLGASERSTNRKHRHAAGLAQSAAVDCWIIGAGAIEFVLAEQDTTKKALADTLATIKNSANSLLEITKLPFHEWTDLSSRWSDSHEEDKALALEHFSYHAAPLACSGGPAVTYTSDVLQTIQSKIKEGEGCPARGLVANQFFRDYIDVVFVKEP